MAACCPTRQAHLDPEQPLMFRESGQWGSARPLNDRTLFHLICAAMAFLPADIRGSTHCIDIRHFTDVHALKET